MMHVINDLNILLITGTYFNDNPYRSLIVSNKFTRSDDILRTTFPRIHYLLSNPIRLKKFLAFQRPIVDDEFASERGHHVTIPVPDLLKAFRNNLKMFISICKIHGIIPVLMTQPNRFTDHPDPIIVESYKIFEKSFGLNYYDYINLFRLFNATILEIANSQKVLVIDLANHIPSSKEYMYDAVHYNEQGSKMVASFIVKSLIPKLYPILSEPQGFDGP